MIYQVLRNIIGFCLNLYYKEIKIKNKKALPKDGPLLIISNHPNTLVDAFVVGYLCPRPIHFLAKATFFNTSLKRKLLSRLNIVPINRVSDGKTSGIDNNDSFNRCYETLEQGKVIAIFPEGTSFLEHHLRELKTGAARVILETVQRNNGNLKVSIIPVGINYTEGYKFRSSLLVNIGNPVDYSEEIKIYADNHSLAARQLTQKFHDELSSLLISFREKTQEKLALKLHHIFTSSYIKNDKNGVEKEVELLRKIQQQLNKIESETPEKYEEIEISTENLLQKLNEIELKPSFLDRRIKLRMFIRQLLFSFIFIILGFPVFIFGIIHNLVIYKCVDTLVPRLTKDIEYYAPLSILLSMVLYPLVYILFLIAVNQYYNLPVYADILYFISMPATGLFAYNFWKYISHINFKTNFVFYLFRNKNYLEQIKKHRNYLRELVFEK